MVVEYKKRLWKDGGHDVHYYYNENDGRIVGRMNKIAHTNIWLSLIIVSHNDEYYLGQYIDYEFSKKAIESYWLIQDRTLIE